MKQRVYATSVWNAKYYKKRNKALINFTIKTDDDDDKKEQNCL